jgi:hypothetical protein
MPWSVASIRAAGILVASLLLFVLIPDRLLAFLARRIVPEWRDLLMLLYWGVAFVIGCWVFVRLQREPSS